jgi:dihydroflavonol-4-reductase
MSGDALVTGATGFLGRRLCRELVDRGWTVGAASRSGADASALSDLDGAVSWHRVDVLDPATVRDAVAGYDRVFHLAGIGLQDVGPDRVREVNATGTDHVVSACEASGVDRLLFASTAGTRRSETVADESDRVEPIGAYQESKAAAERRVDGAVEDGLDAVTVHPTSVFGPGDEKFTGRLCTLATDPKMLAYLPGGASIVGVDDVVDGMIAAVERGDAGEHYLLGGENLAYRQAVSALARAAGRRPPPIRVPPAAVHALGPVAGLADEQLGVRAFPFDREMARLSTQFHFYRSAKARRELGYEYAPFEELLSPALEWYRDR